MAGKRKPAIKEVFDEYAHTAGLDASLLELVVEDRAAPSGTRRISGGEVAAVSRGFLEMRDGSRIPLHKVTEIHSNGGLAFQRPQRRRP